ncbi:MAG TPA: beta-ketoacyl synthase N-terminal-like domain-containing protein, partial [Caulobacteraceae bacterium]|nr:beta-ketoacyl synthase N-terminal-like domain-containing protein [Caulobacteraceae bacterium]
MSRSIVVTGLGAVSALGLDVAENWAAAAAGQCGIAPFTYDPGPHAVGAPTIPSARVKGEVQKALEAALGRRVGVLDPFTVFALKAAHEALTAAGLVGAAALEHRTALVMGHGMPGMQTLETAYERAYGMKTTKVHPLTIPRVMVSAPVSAIAMEFTIRGPVFAV